MELKDILVISIATLIILVVTHFAVFWVVRTLYPPAPAPAPAQVPSVPKPIFAEPTVSVTEQQHVSIPTYEAPVSMEAPRQEGATPIGELPSLPVQRDTGVATANP